jgi:hypothetical protein
VGVLCSDHREPDGWKIVHRHGDHLFDDVRAAPPGEQ